MNTIVQFILCVGTLLTVTGWTNGGWNTYTYVSEHLYHVRKREEEKEGKKSSLSIVNSNYYALGNETPTTTHQLDRMAMLIYQSVK